MTEETKNLENSAEDTLSAMQETASQNAIDDIMELTETEMVEVEEKPEELIDVKSFDETGELNKADEQSELAAKAQNGDDDAIAAFSQSLKSEDNSPVEEPARQEGIDALLDNIGQVAEQATEKVAQPADDLSSKAEMLESASKTYAGKDFSESAENIDENADIETNEEVLEKPTEASMDDIAAAMTEVAPELAEQPKANLTDELANKVTERVALKAVPGISGLQVGFPIEVLAEALRPMVADWVEENLPTIVEKLVKEELSKLADR